MKDNTHKVSGLGLSSGGLVEAAFTPAFQGGHRWYVGDSSEPVLGGDSFPQVSAQRMTVLTGKAGTLRMTEHLAAALLCWPEQSLSIRALQGEIPLRDGSAWPWVSDLKALLGRPQGLQFRECALRTSWDYGHGFCAVEPCAQNALVINASLSRGSYHDQGEWVIRNLHDLEPILQARTFIFNADWERLRAAGQFTNALEGFGILLDEPQNFSELKILSGAPLRHPQEPLLHKIMDLLGDLALLGPQIPRLNIRIHNGGHAVHHQLIERIQNYVPD